jgi:hypothetical protein
LKTAEQPVLAVFVSRDGQSYAPYSWEELCGHFQAGTVVGTDLAWYEGQAEWLQMGQLFATTPSPTPIHTPTPQPISVPVPKSGAVGLPAVGKPVGPLYMSGSTGAKPLANPSTLSVSTPKAAEKTKTDSKSKAKEKKKWGKRQDIQLPRWSKWVGSGVVVLVVVGWIFTGGVLNVDRTQQIIGQAVRNELNIHSGELEDADYQKAENLKLTGKGLTDLKFLSKCTGVVKLNLSGNKISDLNPLVGLSKLEELNLSQNQINDFKPLEKLPSLKVLRIDGNPGTSKSTKDTLKRALPNCKFPK